MKIIFTAALFLAGNILYISAETRWGNWTKWGEQDDSVYYNPIIPSDFSDIDCIRVNDDYYAISSTFQFSPGMTVLHSRDLVNWEILTNSVGDLTSISEELNYNRMNRYARGIWAGSLRYHNNRYYLFFGTPDEGFFMTSAPEAIGPWEPLTPLLLSKGWDDCTAFWDDETGKAWFAGTHFADGYKTYLFPMTPDGKSIAVDQAKLINEGNGREASKLIKHGEWLYLIFSEHRDGIGRYVMAKRTKDIENGFEEERQLALPSVEANEPNQGGIIEGPDNNWYFLTHHGTGDWSGRIVSLLPVSWIDGWPIMGTILHEGIGQMCWSGKMPSVNGKKYRIEANDEFDNDYLLPQWQWNYQPRMSHISLTERRGWLRLKAFRPLKYDTLLKAGNTLTARTFRTPHNQVTIKMDISGMADGQKCGLCHFSAASSAIGIVQDNGERFIESRINDHIIRVAPVNGGDIWLRSEWGLDGMSRYYYSTDGDYFTPCGEDYQLAWGNYRGDRYGIYCFNNLSDEGYVDVDYCHYDF